MLGIQKNISLDYMLAGYNLREVFVFDRPITQVSPTPFASFYLRGGELILVQGQRSGSSAPVLLFEGQDDSEALTLPISALSVFPFYNTKYDKVLLKSNSTSAWATWFFSIYEKSPALKTFFM